MVTELAATPKRLLWIVDAGADKLEVRELAQLGRCHSYDRGLSSKTL